MKADLARRDWLLMAGLLGVMFLATLMSARQETGADAPPALTSHSTAADGAQGLLLWLEALGYPVRRIEGSSFDVGPQDRLLFVLSPQQDFSQGEILLVEKWVERGGTLIMATDGWVTDPLMEHFDLEIEFLDQHVEAAGPAQPVLLDPPWIRAQVRADRYLVTNRDDVVRHLVAEGQTLLLSFKWGRGRVFAASMGYPFTNRGLEDVGNARLVHNLVATVGAGAPVAFDEFHHGYQSARTLTTWLRTTPQGHGLLYVALVIFLYLLIGGRRFGRPLPLPETTIRRRPVEHVRAMANLFRRGGKRAAILQHYHDRLKRELASPHPIDPNLRDAEFVARLSVLRPDLDRTALSKLLEKTSQSRVNEGGLVHLAKEVDQWIEKTG